MNRVLKILIVLVVVIVILALVKNALIKFAIEKTARQVIGADVRIGGLSLSLFKQSLRVTDFQLYNPPGFPNEVMVDIPDMGVDCDLAAIMKGDLHLSYLRVNLKEVRVIRNRDGKLNVNSLKVAQPPQQAKSPQPGPAGQPGPKKEVKMRLDLVSLNVGRVIYSDYTFGNPPPNVTTQDINIRNKEFRNVTDASTLTSLVLMEALKSTAIKGITIYGISPGNLFDQLKGLFK